MYLLWGARLLEATEVEAGLASINDISVECNISLKGDNKKLLFFIAAPLRDMIMFVLFVAHTLLQHTVAFPRFYHSFYP